MIIPFINDNSLHQWEFLSSMRISFHLWTISHYQVHVTFVVLPVLPVVIDHSRCRTSLSLTWWWSQWPPCPPPPHSLGESSGQGSVSSWPRWRRTARRRPSCTPPARLSENTGQWFRARLEQEVTYFILHLSHLEFCKSLKPVILGKFSNITT